MERRAGAARGRRPRRGCATDGRPSRSRANAFGNDPGGGLVVTSTVVDATLCLVLVSAAAVSFVGLPADSADDAAAGRADAVAETVATGTAAVNYTLAPGARHADGESVAFRTEAGSAFERTAHGTLAELLSEGAVGGLWIDGERPTRTSDDFRRAVREATANATPRGTRVVAAWRPYEGAPVGGRLAVGPRPPADATVHAATLSVPSGFAAGDATAAARADGYRGVATLVAEALVAGLFPPRRTTLALREASPTDALTRYRYRRVAALFDAGSNANATVPDRSPADGRVEAANDRLATAVADAVAADLRRRFDSPTAAADAVELQRARIVVRTWSA